MLKAVLFDLDDTLLHNNMDTFLPRYFRLLTRKMAPLIPPQKLIESIMASTERMMAPDHPDRTNEEVFWADFEQRVGIPREKLKPLFEDFYAGEYRRLREIVKPKPEAREIISCALDLGMQVVIATNPLFPRVAVEERMRWAGIEDLPFALVTTLENMHYCKPHPQYYQEVLEKIGRRPEECLMVGNSVEDDIVPAKRAGLLTYCVVEEPSPDPPPPEADYCGPLEGVKELLEGRCR